MQPMKMAAAEGVDTDGALFTVAQFASPAGTTAPSRPSSSRFPMSPLHVAQLLHRHLRGRRGYPGAHGDKLTDPNFTAKYGDALSSTSSPQICAFWPLPTGRSAQARWPSCCPAWGHLAWRQGLLQQVVEPRPRQPPLPFLAPRLDLHRDGSSAVAVIPNLDALSMGSDLRSVMLTEIGVSQRPRRTGAGDADPLSPCTTLGVSGSSHEALRALRASTLHGADKAADEA